MIDGLRQDRLGGFNPQRTQRTRPYPVIGVSSVFEHQVELDIDDASGMLGALQIPAHPIQAVRDAGKHSVSQSSILKVWSSMEHPRILAAAALRRIDH